MPRVTPDATRSPVLLEDSGIPHGDVQDTGLSSQPTMALIATSSEDFSTGALALVSIEGLDVSDTVVPLAGDVVVQTDEGTSFIISRHNTDTIRVYDSADFNNPQLDFSVGDQSNPQDAQICGGRLFVTLHNRAEIPVYDPASGQRTGSVDLTEFAGDDGAAEASDLVEIDGRLFAAIQQLDQTQGWTSDSGAILEIDCASASILSRVVTGPSPNLFAQPRDTNHLWVRTGVYGTHDGGLSRLDIGTGELEKVLDESDIEADLTDADASAETVFLVSADSNWQYTIGCIDIQTSIYTAGPSYPNYLSDVEVDPFGRAWVATRPGWSSDAPVPGGIRLIDGATCTPLLADDGRIATTLPPFDLAFL